MYPSLVYLVMLMEFKEVTWPGVGKGEVHGD